MDQEGSRTAETAEFFNKEMAEIVVVARQVAHVHYFGILPGHLS